jgi:ribosomal-protein-serine acetyltransferase
LTRPPAIQIPEQFESERLTIRAPRLRDAAEVSAAVRESIEELRPWMPWAQEPPSMEATRANQLRARRKYLAGKDFRLNIFLKGTETFVGGSGLRTTDDRR